MKTYILGVALAGALMAACGDGSATTIDGAPVVLVDAGVNDAALPDASCFEDPQTYLQLINACTDAVKIEKHPSLPLLNPDGTLPPLPE